MEILPSGHASQPADGPFQGCAGDFDLGLRVGAADAGVGQGDLGIQLAKPPARLPDFVLGAAGIEEFQLYREADEEAVVAV